MNQDEGFVRAVYVGLVTRLRGLLDGTRLLRAWDRLALADPRGRMFHLRTLLALHRPEDLILLDVPWWTYQARDRVEAFLAARDGQAQVLEFGSGASTVWLARRASSVHAVEHDEFWAGRVQAMLDGMTGLRSRPLLHVPAVMRSEHPRVASGAPSGRGLDFSEYVDLPAALGTRFDLVLVDGRAREESLLRALALLSPGGLALLDDSQWARYQPTLRRLADEGWVVETTRGATPCQPFPRETTLISAAPPAPA